MRVIRKEDLSELVSFYNGLVEEKQQNPDSELHTGFDRKLAIYEESEWLNQTLAAIEKGEMICIVAEVNGRIVANCGVTRGKYSDTHHHGSLGLTVSRAYRSVGIGHMMIEKLITESHQVGIKNLEVEFLSTNLGAKAAYEKAGFRETGRITGKVFRNGRYIDASIMSKELL